MGEVHVVHVSIVPRVVMGNITVRPRNTVRRRPVPAGRVRDNRSRSGEPRPLGGGGRVGESRGTPQTRRPPRMRNDPRTAPTEDHGEGGENGETAEGPRAWSVTRDQAVERRPYLPPA